MRWRTKEKGGGLGTIYCERAGSLGLKACVVFGR